MKKVLILVGVFVLLASPVYAITGVGIGVRGGFVHNYDNPGIDKSSLGLDLNKMPMLGAHVVFGFIPMLDIEGSAEMAWKKKEFTEQTITAEFTVRDFSMNATAKYKFNFMPTIKPYIGAGLGWHWLTYSVSSDDVTVTTPMDENRLGYHGLAGVSFRLPAVPFEFFGEYRYTRILTKQEDLDSKGTDFTTILAGITFGF